MRELEIENEILKKSYCHIRQRTITEYMSFIQKHLHLYTVRQMCKTLKFPRTTYYRALLSEPSNKKKEYEAFSEKVMEYYLDSQKRYGAVKLCRL